jgi:tail tube protein gp19
MRASAPSYIIFGLGLTLGVALPYSASAQAPAVEDPAPPSTRLMGPATRGAVIEQPAPPDAPTPVAQTPGQPTTDASAPPVTQVTGAPAGTTQVGAAPGATSSSSQAATAVYSSDKRSYTAGKFGLLLDGVQVGPVRSVEGGTASADVIEEPPGPEKVVMKHIGQPKYEPISISTTWDSKPLMDWIAASWKQNYQRKNGSVQDADYNNTVRREREFFNALLTEVTMPLLDGSSKDAAQIIVKIAPEYTRLKAGSGSIKSGFDLKQKKWTPANFKFEMTGLDGTKVNRIESFTVAQKTVADQIGEARDYLKEPGKLSFPNLTITLNESSSQTWWDWYTDFLIQGNNTEDKERNGSIVYLDPLQKEIGRVNLYNCGIFGLAPTPSQQGSEAIARVQASLYCERMELVTVK